MPGRRSVTHPTAAELKAKVDKAGGEARKKYREAELARQEKAKALRAKTVSLMASRMAANMDFPPTVMWCPIFSKNFATPSASSTAASCSPIAASLAS